MKYFIFIVMITGLTALPVGGAGAQSGAKTSSDKPPIEITAADSIEWNQQENFYRATGNAMASQAEGTVKAEQLTAHYDPEADRQIKVIVAEDNVVITFGEMKARGDHAVYSPAIGKLVLTGGDLTVETGEYTITARDEIRYLTQENKAEAIGHVTVFDGQNHLYADMMTALFDSEAGGLKEARAWDNVKIEADDETITGNRAIYTAADQRAVIEGDVEIRQGRTRLNGEKAFLNLKTGVSQLTTATPRDNQEKGRVKALFYTE